MADLVQKKCKPCEGGVKPLGQSEIATLLKQIPAWESVNGAIIKTFVFKNYDQTIAFVNATAWISHRENHHPDLTVSYNQCKVAYSTHAIGGLSENDFICAAKVEALFNI